MSAERHLLRRCVLDVTLHGAEADGLAVERSLTRLSRDWLAPALDRGLAGLSGPDETWVIDRLTVELPMVSADRLEQDFAALLETAVARALRDHIANAGVARPSSPWPLSASDRSGPAIRRDGVPDEAGNGPAPIRRRTSAAAPVEAFACFLKTGVLPWWFRPAEGLTLEEMLVAAWPEGVPPRGHLHPVLAAAAGAVPSVALVRLVRQFSPPFLEALLEAIRPGSTGPVQAALARLETAAFSGPARRQAIERLRLAAFRDAVAAPSEVKAVERLTREWDAAQTLGPPDAPGEPKGNPDPAVPAPADMPAPAAAFDLDEGLLVDCAGLVLLHPFLPRLFAALGLVADDRLTDPDRALGLLHYLATGQRSAPEHALPLAKLLCNLPLEAPAGAPVTLSDGDCEEADALLDAVIGHWDALGSISIDTLRGSFLIRPGRLIRRGEDRVLQVEPNAFDILLDRLPWGMSAVRLPWMPNILWVEWTY